MPVLPQQLGAAIKKKLADTAGVTKTAQAEAAAVKAKLVRDISLVFRLRAA
jgi:hypothetical protein